MFCRWPKGDRRTWDHLSRNNQFKLQAPVSYPFYDAVGKAASRRNFADSSGGVGLM
jgi:hypothetical protein